MRDCPWISKPPFLFFSQLDPFWLGFTQELFRGKSLRHWIEEGKFAPSKRVEICQELLKIVGDLLKNDILHSDIQPDNVMFAEIGADGLPRQMKLIDFGIAGDLADPMEAHSRTNLEYAHPNDYEVRLELLKKEEPQQIKQFEWASEIFAIGCNWIYILTGKSWKGRWREEAEKIYSKELIQLIEEMQSGHWQNRPTLAELQDRFPK
jgi:serine/threonine protein kinase